MPSFTYRGLDGYGKSVKGQVVADHERSALEQIKAQGLFPTDVRSIDSSRDKRPSIPPCTIRSAGKSRGIGRILTGGVNSADLTVFSRQLANLAGRGLPLMRTFAALTEHTENPRLRAILTDMQQEVQGGKTLWEGFAQYPSIFPPLYVSMVKAGEASGQLSSILQWLADYLEKTHTRRLQIRGALAYPALLVLVGTISVSLLITLVVPNFVTIFQEFGQALPTPTVILLGVSSAVSRWWWVIICAALSVALGFRQFARTPNGRLRVDGYMLKMPLFGKLRLKSTVSRFARTTATLLRGGVPLLDAIAVVKEVMGNEVLARGIDQVREGIRQGESFAARLREAGVFPPLLSHMVGIGEETGDLQSVLLMVADSYDVEVDAALKIIVSVLEPMIILTVGATVAFIILAMLLPVFQINMMGG